MPAAGAEIVPEPVACTERADRRIARGGKGAKSEHPAMEFLELARFKTLVDCTPEMYYYQGLICTRLKGRMIYQGRLLHFCVKAIELQSYCWEVDPDR